MFTYQKIVFGFAALTVGAIGFNPVAAATTVGSGAYGVSVNLSVASILKASVGPLGSISDLTGDAVYTGSNPVISASNNTALLASTGSGFNLTTLRMAISTGIIDNDISGGPLPGTQIANASSIVNNLNFSLKTDILGVPLLNVFTLSAGTLNSTANANGNPTANVSGSAGITNLNLSLAGIGLIVNSNAFANAAPNTDLLGFLNLAPITGLRIIVNEQIKPNTNDAAGARITTNALHLIFDGLPIIGGQVLRGDVVISQSRAFIESANSPTPEPAVWAQMIAGFGLIGLVTRRRRIAAAA